MLQRMVDEAPQPSQVEYVGPFESYRVVVNGWQVPLLQAHPVTGGGISLTLDDRYALDLPLQDAERIVPFIANAIAISLGYARHPDTPEEELHRRPAMEPKRLLRLDWTEPEESSAS
jgi:hypothetical protein